MTQKNMPLSKREREIKRQDEEHLAVTLAKENRLREAGIDPDCHPLELMMHLEKRLEELKNTAKNG